MTMGQYIQEAESVLLHTYNRYPIVLDRGEGVYLYDIEGKKYLDFCAGIAVFALGYGNKSYNDALKEQIDKLLHTSNYYYTVPAVRAAQKLAEASGMDRVFFTNSGAEAIEGAIKAARKYAYMKDGSNDHEMIAMENSFHGRTMGALSVTGNPKYREAFYPLIGNINYAKYNDIDSVKALLSDKTCAIILETVQGEGGIHPAEKEFLKEIRRLCDENGMLLILDEIQCGMGRTGRMFAYEHYGVMPDIMTVAKAVGGGVPVGAFLMTQKVADQSLAAGDHGTTYGGNPFVTAAVNAVFDQFKEKEILSNVCEVAPYLEDRLDMLIRKYDFLTGRRGIGLMQGLVFDTGKMLPADVSKRALDNGLVIITAGADVLRFLPPLIITKADVDEMLVRLEKSFMI
ncbi:MAG TPA: aspartate aminotransferase family protein [Lachnospiraceae bacterium]|nr:aspartate aminotransferase family protein [Lachnospiraceae bacterium]